MHSFSLLFHRKRDGSDPDFIAQLGKRKGLVQCEFVARFGDRKQKCSEKAFVECNYPLRCSVFCTNNEPF